LNISKKIVTHHNGQIGFESEQGKRTAFWFFYPVAAEGTSAEVVGTVGQDQKGFDKRQVLHLEDDQDFAEVVRSSLSQVANVTSVGSIANALPKIRQAGTHFDVVIVDWELTDGDAAKLLDEIFKNNPNAYVFGLSANEDRPGDARVKTCLVKTRTELHTIADHVSGLGNSHCERA
jgi:CheY-like chemotaxis protein